MLLRSPPAPRRVLVAGLGQAGARFVRACLAINKTSGGVQIIGGVEPDPARRQAFNQIGFPCFGSVAEAAAALDAPPEVAIVTVPEVRHFEILRELKLHFPCLGRVLCEKPLTATMAEATALRALYGDRDLSLNFVERFSPIVEAFRTYVAAHGRKVVRSNCFWGKYRIKDSRPTPGVIAVELAHPIDLIAFLADVPTGTPYQIASVVAGRSNFDVGSNPIQPLDTLHIAMAFKGGPQVFTSTSLLWSSRQRRIELILAGPDGLATELAVLNFDQPIWDLDRFDLYDIRATGGKPTLISSLELTRSWWQEDRLTIGKVCKFVEANLDDMDGACGDTLPRLEQGIYVQEILEAIEDAAQAQALSLSCFGAPVANGAPKLEPQIDLLRRLRRQHRVAKSSDFIWDVSY